MKKQNCLLLLLLSFVLLTGTVSQADWFEVRGGLDRCAVKFQQEKTGRVVFLGGSITEGGAWRDMAAQEIQKRFPETKFEFVNAGISSTGSTPGAFRLTTQVFGNVSNKGQLLGSQFEFKNVDLLFEEAAVNDSTNFRTSTEMLRGMEGIIRHAKTLNPLIDIVQLHFADPDKNAQFAKGEVPVVIAQHERVAIHYNNPSINLAKEVYDRIQAKEFSWKEDFKDLHPSLFGHKLYYASICRLFDACWGKNIPADTVAVDKRTEAVLPEPLDKFSYFRGHYVNIKQAQLGDGWNYVEKWTPTARIGARAGFVHVPVLECTQPGKELTFDFTGTAVGIFVASGLDCGIVEYSIDGSPWQQKDFFTQWSPSLYLPWSQVLSGDLSDGNHTLKLRLSAQKNARSQGTALRIVHFLVN